MSTTIEVAPQRAVRYWYDDGLAEIGAGLLFLLLAALFAIEGLAPAGSLPPWSSAIGLPVVIIGGMLVLRLALHAAKEKLTYPRTGYVSYPHTQPARKWIAGLLGGVVSLLVVLFLMTRPGWLIAVPALQGAAIAVVLGLMSYRTGVLRLMIPAILGAASGVIASLLGMDTWLGTGVVLGTTALASLLCGAFVLARYLRTTSRPTEEA